MKKRFLTQEMRRDGPFKVHILRTIEVVELPPDKSMKVVVEGLDGIEELLQILLEGRGIVPRAPVSACVRKS